VCDPSVADDETADQVLSSSQSSHDNNLETLQVAVEEENVEVGETVALEGEPEHPSEEDPAKDDHEVIDLDLGTEEDQTGDTEDVAEVEAGWGEFPENDSGCQGAGEAWGNFPADEWSLPTEANQEDREDRDDFQFDESEDDDFGDFGEAPELVQNNEVKEESRILFDLSELRNKTCSLLESVYGLSSGGEPPGDCEEEFKNNLEATVLSEGQIFEKIDNPASAPALNHQWRDSLTYSSLLLTLGIDSSSNLDGEEWRSSAPRSAASLMTPGLLTPEALSEKPEPQEQKSSEGDTVTPAQFDWNKSGLTDPLSENVGAKSSPDPTISQVEEDNNNGDGGKLYQDHVRREAQNVLDGLPLLNFMSSNVLMFPTKSINKR